MAGRLILSLIFSLYTGSDFILLPWTWSKPQVGCAIAWIDKSKAMADAISFDKRMRRVFDRICIQSGFRPKENGKKMILIYRN
jgi:hypothetical protein